jgi:signal transduction histidine kinase/ligand-binding sensor domain-containing protein/CheY-like chemotaxis protein/AraC-like DNA-binding protein
LQVRRIVFTILLSLNYCTILYANSESIKIEDYSYKDGLTTSGVFNACKDSKGFLWLCSLNGLFRFDGYSFRNINTLIEDKINRGTLCITEDAYHNFWIGTANGIFYYNTHTERIFPVKLNINKNFRSLQILFTKDKIWVASSIGLLLFNSQSKFNPDTIYQARILLPDSAHKRTIQDNIINALFYTDGSPSLWVGTNGALYELDLKKLTFFYINSYSQNSIRCISKYKNGIIASSWDGGVFLINPDKHVVENDPFIIEINKIIGEKRIMSAIIDKQNRLWVATYGNGLFIFEKNKNGIVSSLNYRNNEIKQDDLKSDFINQMYIDNEGIIWLCMNQPALSKVFFQKSNLTYFNFFVQKNYYDSKEILSVQQSTDKNKLWITTNGDGIYLLDIKTHNFRQYINKTTSGLRLQDNEVLSCYQDRKGNLWIVYRKIGLYVVPSKTILELSKGIIQTFVYPVDANILLAADSRANSYITSFFEDSDGRLWIGGWASLYIVELKQNLSNSITTNNLLSESKVTCIFSEATQDKISFPLSPVLSIVEVKKGQYWLGTFGPGIIQLDEISKNRFSDKRLAINNKLPTNGIKVIYTDKRNGLWIGTNSGLCYWNYKTNNLKIITVKNGLASDNINNIIEDKNSDIWVSTSYGISKITVKDFSVISYFYTDMEKLNQYIQNAAALSSEGLVCFSTNKALVKINPDSAELDKRNAPLYFTDIKIDNKNVIPSEKYYGTRIIDININECKTINVPYNHTLSIEFAALDFIDPNRTTYKYRVGKNSEWILLNSNQRSLSLPNIKPGEYLLSVMLANSPNDNQIRSIKIHYLPPFWQSLPALFVYFVVLLILFIMYRRLAMQRILQKSVIENERYERRKLEELDKMKSEFFSNISHEFRTPLSLIINPLEKLAKDANISGRNKEKINLILKSSNRLLKLTNELMDFGKIEKNLLVPDLELCELVTFINQICRLFDNLADSINVDYKLNCSFEQLEIPVDKGMIEKVIFNLLSNAFKYTPANGMIMVNISSQQIEENEFVKISVINTGEGIDKKNLNRIFDRFYQVNNLQNRNIEGTGIGLALVKNFVELHNGWVEVKSEHDVETCFEVYLPVKQENFRRIDKTDTNTSNDFTSLNLYPEIKTKDNKPNYHYRLLLIEDEDDIRNYIIDELSEDFKIISAKNGEEGVKVANEMIPDLIITDVIMPVMTGVELCKILKNQLITSHIPIIILSAKTTIAEQIEGLEIGADIYMIKPFSIEHLKTQIIRLIQFKETVYSRYLKDNTLVPQGTVITNLDKEFIQKVIAFIEENLSDAGLNVEQISECVLLSKVQTYRKVKAISGLSIVEFIRTIRLKKAADLIMERKSSFTEISYETGFSSLSYFTKCFHDHYGKSPSEFASDYGK